MNIDIEFDGKAVLASFEKFAKVVDSPQFFQAILDAAIVAEGEVKKELKRLIYDKPERSGYKRKMGAGLFGATKATRKVSRSRTEIKSAVISAKHYAIYVHMGTGRLAKDGKGKQSIAGQSPKPFMTNGLKNAKNNVMKLLGKYLMK